jgi:hypothetical protein
MIYEHLCLRLSPEKREFLIVVKHKIDYEPEPECVSLLN